MVLPLKVIVGRRRLDNVNGCIRSGRIRVSRIKRIYARSNRPTFHVSGSCLPQVRFSSSNKCVVNGRFCLSQRVFGCTCKCLRINIVIDRVNISILTVIHFRRFCNILNFFFAFLKSRLSIRGAACTCVSFREMFTLSSILSRRFRGTTDSALVRRAYRVRVSFTSKSIAS